MYPVRDVLMREPTTVGDDGQADARTSIGTRSANSSTSSMAARSTTTSLWGLDLVRHGLPGTRRGTAALVEKCTDDSPASAPSDSTDVLFRRYRATRNRAIRNELVVRHQWLAERCAQRFRNRGEPHCDIVQVAQLGLVKAVERFDPTRRTSFASFAIPTITGEIKRHFRDHTWSVRVPRRSKDLMVSVREGTEALHHRLGHSPTVDEVAAYIGSNRETVLETMEAGAAYRSSSIDQLMRGDAIPIRDLLGGEDRDLEGAVLRVTSRQALANLDERSREVLYWRFYEQCTQDEIGARLGIGQVQVSRLLRSLLKKLRNEIDASGP